MVDWKSIVVIFGLLVGATMLSSCDDTKKEEAKDAAVEVVEEVKEVAVEAVEVTTEVVQDSTVAVEEVAVEEVVAE